MKEKMSKWASRIEKADVRGIVSIVLVAGSIAMGEEQNADWLKSCQRRLGLADEDAPQIAVDLTEINRELQADLEGTEDKAAKDSFLAEIAGRTFLRYRAANACHCEGCKSLVERLVSGERKSFLAFAGSQGWPERIALLNGLRQAAIRARDMLDMIPIRDMVLKIACNRLVEATEKFLSEQGTPLSAIPTTLNGVREALVEAAGLETDDWTDWCAQHNEIILRDVCPHLFPSAPLSA